MGGLVDVYALGDVDDKTIKRSADGNQMAQVEGVSIPEVRDPQHSMYS